MPVSAERRAGGVFYTPAPLVEAILDRFLTDLPTGAAPRVLDPACGDGEFLAGVARRLPGAQLSGIEQDPAALQFARQRLPGLTALPGDGLDPAVGPPPASIDLVVGNPPFIRCRALPPERRTELRRRYDTARGPFDLAVPFVERSLDWLKPGGRLVLVLPNRLLVAGYAAALRRLLCRETLEEILDLSDHELFPAAAYPVVLTLTRGRPPEHHRLRLVEARLETPAGAPPRLSSQQVRLVSAEPDELAGPARSDPLVEEVLSRGFPLFGEWLRLREGLHTGNIRERLLRSSPQGESDRPVLRGRDCQRYQLSWAGLWVATDPTLIDRSRGEYANIPPPELFRGPKLLLREISQRPAACLDPGHHWTLNKVYPLQELHRLEEEERLACLGLINSASFHRIYQSLFRATHLRGGYLQFKARYVQRMPLPPPGELVRQGLGRLARRRLSAGPDPELERALDEAAARSYLHRPGEGLPHPPDLHVRGPQSPARTTRGNTDDPDP